MRSTLGGSKTAFVLKLNAAGNTLLLALIWADRITTWVPRLPSTQPGNAYVAGDTQSADFPVIGGFQAAIGGGFDAFVTKLNSTGAYVYSTFLGGVGE